MLPYLVTIIVLVTISFRKSKKNSPPAAWVSLISEKSGRVYIKITMGISVKRMCPFYFRK
jgi:hypothetical protein